MEGLKLDLSSVMVSESLSQSSSSSSTPQHSPTSASSPNRLLGAQSNIIACNINDSNSQNQQEQLNKSFQHFAQLSVVDSAADNIVSTTNSYNNGHTFGSIQNNQNNNSQTNTNNNSQINTTNSSIINNNISQSTSTKQKLTQSLPTFTQHNNNNGIILLNTTNNSSNSSSGFKLNKATLTSTSSNNLLNNPNISPLVGSSSPSRQSDLQRELDLKSVELRQKEEEILSLKIEMTGLKELYSQELSFCCKYSDEIAKLQKEFQSMKNHYLSREEQYKKQVQDLQQKLYSSNFS